MRFFIYSLLAFCLLSVTVLAADKKQAASAPAPAGGSNAITQGFVSKGVLSCAARINQVTGFLTSGTSSSGAYLFGMGNNPDNQMVTTSMEIIEANKKSAYTSATFAPNQVNGCGAVYEAVSWWPGKCEAVAKSQFAGQKVASQLKSNISILNIGPSSRVFLMPTSDGCISIKKELVQ